MPKVNIGGGGRFDLDKTTDPYVQHCDTFYPQWKEFKCRHFLIPPVYISKYVGPTDSHASCHQMLDSGTESVIQGDKCERAIWKLLAAAFGSQDRRPFVISGPTYFREENFKTEITDFLIIDDRHLTIIEVKSTDMEEPGKVNRRLRDASSQLKKAGEFFSKLIADLLSKMCDNSSQGVFPNEAFLLPIQKVIFLPNVSFESKQFEDCAILDNSFTNVENFSTWYNTIWSAVEKPQNIHLFEIFVAVCICHRNTVASFTLKNLYDTIDTQKFLEASFQRQRKRQRTSENTNRATTIVQVNKIILDNRNLAKQFYFLNPEQSAFYYGHNRQIIFGEFGTGKTLLIKHRLLIQCQASKELCLFLTDFPNVITLYKEFLENNNVACRMVTDFDPNSDTTSVLLINVCLLSHSDTDMYRRILTCIEIALQKADKFSVFADENDKLFIVNKAIFQLVTVFESKLNYFWISQLSELEHDGEINKDPEEFNFNLSELKTHMRSSVDVYSFLMQNKFLSTDIAIGHNVSGIVDTPKYQLIKDCSIQPRNLAKVMSSIANVLFKETNTITSNIHHSISVDSAMNFTELVSHLSCLTWGIFQNSLSKENLAEEIVAYCPRSSRQEMAKLTKYILNLLRQKCESEFSNVFSRIIASENYGQTAENFPTEKHQLQKIIINTTFVSVG